MSGTTVSVDRVIKAPASAIFAIVSDASRHAEIDGSGSVVKVKDGAPEHLRLGSVFDMSMKLGVPYSMSNTVIEFEPDRRIAWQTQVAGPLGRFFGGRIWRYQFEETGAGTKVTETWDISAGQAELPAAQRQGRAAVCGHDVQDARQAGRADRAPGRRQRPGVGLMSAATRIDAAEIDEAWEAARPPRAQRVHPYPLPLPRLRPRVAGPRPHRRGGRPAPPMGGRSGRRPLDRESSSCRGARPCCWWTTEAAAIRSSSTDTWTSSRRSARGVRASAPTNPCARANSSTGEERQTTATRPLPP